ncbi:MAG: hypothetical protein HYV60_18645, partial [Planctomycetia bacterium]|nr:hypothetical protein [Planctomycetia bacterium]
MKKKHGARRAQGRKRRQRLPLFEVLEWRWMLSGTPVTAAQQRALLDGLDSLVTWSSTWTGLNELGVSINALRPTADGLRPELGQIVNPRRVLDESLRHPLEQYLATPGAQFANTSQIASLLGAVDQSDSSTLLFHATVTGESTRSFELELDRFQDADRLRFDPSQTIKVDFSAQMAFEFSFGLKLAPELAAEDAFFIRAEGIEFSGQAHATSLALLAQVGFLDMQVNDGTLMLDLAVTGDFRDPVTDAVLDLTRAEFLARPASELLELDSPRHEYSLAFPLLPSPDQDGVRRIDLGGAVVARTFGDLLNDAANEVVFEGDATTELGVFFRLDSVGMLDV